MHRAAVKGREKALRLLISKKVKVRSQIPCSAPPTPPPPRARVHNNLLYVACTPHGLLQIVCDALIHLVALYE